MASASRRFRTSQCLSRYSAGSTCCGYPGGRAGRRPTAARPLLSAKISLQKGTSPLAFPPSRPGGLSEALHGEEKAESLPFCPRVLPRTLEGAVSQHHWVPLRAASLRPHLLSLLTPVPGVKGPGATPAAGEAGILGGSVQPPSGLSGVLRKEDKCFFPRHAGVEFTRMICLFFRE